MNIINFNENNIIGEIDHGIESTVFLYNDNGNRVALKKYKSKEEMTYSKDLVLLKQLNYDDIFFNYKSDKFFLSNDNKELKLIILKNESTLKHDIKLLDRVYYMGKFIGFTSVYEPYKPISVINKKTEKIEVLKALQARYEELNKHGIFIGDFNYKNITMTSNGIKLYDIDNFRIDNLDFNVTNPVMRKYLKKFKNINNMDYYCFNYFALSYLSDYTMQAVLDNVAIYEYPSYLRTPEMLDFIDFLNNMDENTVIERTKDGKPKTLLNIIK